MDSRAQALKEQGNKAFTEGRNEEAVRLYTQALELGGSAVLFSNRAAAYLKLAKNAEALEDADAAISVDPSFTKAYARKANALVDLGKLEEARAALKAGLEVDPSSALLKQQLLQLEPKAPAAGAGTSSTAGGRAHAREAENASNLGELAPLVATFTSAWARELGELLEGRPAATTKSDGLDSILTALRGTRKLDRRLSCIDALVAGVWSTIAGHPSLTSVTTGMLQSSAVLDKLFTFIAAACALSSDIDNAVRKGGRVLAAAITSAFKGAIDAEREATLVSLLAFFGGYCAAGPLRLPDPWGACDGFANKHPMMAAALLGPPALLSVLASKGVPVDDQSDDYRIHQLPLWAAYLRGREDIFDRLLELGADYDFSFAVQFCFHLGRCACHDDQDFDFRQRCKHNNAEGVRAARLAIVRKVVADAPQFLTVEYNDKEGRPCNLLDAAITSGDAGLVDLILELGVAPRFTAGSTLERALMRGKHEVVELLVNKYKLAESNSQYDEAGLSGLALAVAMTAVESYPANPRFDGPPNLATKHAKPSSSETLDLILSSGIRAFWNAATGRNELLAVLYCGRQHAMLSEPHTLELLERFRKAGWNVGSVFKSGVTPSSPQGNGLAILAARNNQLAVFDYAFETAGCDVDGVFKWPNGPDTINTTTLVQCFVPSSTTFVEKLLTKYKAKASYPGARLQEQPVYVVLTNGAYTDAQAEKILRLMIANSPGLLDLDCYCERGTPGTGTGTVSWTPVYGSAVLWKPLCLELLLTSMPAAKQMACQRVTVKDHLSRWSPMTALHGTIAVGAWDSASVLLRLASPSVTEPLDASLWASGRQPFFKSALEDIRRVAGNSNTPPPRALLAAFEAAARRELDAGKAKSASSSSTGATGEGATTNAFEMPADADDAFGSGAMPRAKKPAGKKKSDKKKGGKGKKKKKNGKVGAAAAATGVDGDSSSEDGDEESFEEPDDNLVDSRYAPSFDVLLAEREREKDGKEGPASREKK